MASPDGSTRRSFVPHFVGGFLAIYGTFAAVTFLALTPDAPFGLGARLAMTATSGLLAGTGALVGAALVHRRHRWALADAVTAGRTALAGALAGVGGVVLGATMNGTSMPMPVEVPAPVMNALGMGVGLVVFAAVGAAATRLLYAPWLRRHRAPAAIEATDAVPALSSPSPAAEPIATRSRTHVPRGG